MTMWYNLTSINATTMLSFTQGINETLMFDWFGTLILMVLWFVSFISMNYFWDDTKINFTASSFFVAIISMIFVILNLTFNYIPFVIWGFFVVGIISTLLSR